MHGVRKRVFMSEIKNKETNQNNTPVRFKDFDLDNQIKRALSELGFKHPLEVQAIVLPKILEGKDLIVKSQTGSGKTASFAIPICEKIDIELEETQAVVLAPTRELAAQVREDINDIGKYKGVTSCAIYGNSPMDEQRRMLKTKPHIVVATPGRLLDHLKNKNIKLKEIKYFVIDEADEMLIMGFKEQIEYIISKTSKDRVTLLFSATMPDEVKTLSQCYMRQPESIEIESEVSNVDKIDQLYYAVDGLRKVDFMKKMIRYEQPRKCVIFCNTKEQVDNLYSFFKKPFPKLVAVHGGMDQRERTEKIRGFKKGDYNMLIATDVAARGLHVQGISHVINYGVPFDNENYIHRIGRTGRVDQHGVAITMVIPSEMERFKELEAFLGYEIPCKGGYVDKKPKQMTKRRNGQEKFKVDSSKGRGETVQIKAGRTNSTLKTSDLLYTIKKIPGITNDDIGKVNFKDLTTDIVIYNGKGLMVKKALREMKIRKKQYRVK